MIRDGRMPSPEEAKAQANERSRLARVKRERQPAVQKRKAELEAAREASRLAWTLEYADRDAQPLYEALRWLKMAAEHGSTDAMASLGYDYERGQEYVTLGLPGLVEKDYAEAMRWYRKAADVGSATAMRHVGELYYSGHGVPLDYSDAMR